jgi:hypothetical protein
MRANFYNAESFLLMMNQSIFANLLTSDVVESNKEKTYFGNE